MYWKLAIQNIRRSLRDYIIYFVTLTLTAALMYSFLALGSQNSDAEESQRGNNKAFGLEKLLHILHTLLFCCYIKPIR